MTTPSTHVQLGFHCSHEQHAPGALLRLARDAERAGFTHAMCSDHFHPWLESQGHSGYAWSWLGAALQATGMTFGTVCAPGQRYHPAVVAQAAATLAEMFDGRLWVSLGSGEALNESITGDAWPPRSQRNARLEECVGIMRALWAGDTVTHDGLVRVRGAKLYSRPGRPPMIVGAALSAETAGWMGRWADALITVSAPIDRLREIIDAFRDGGGAGKPIFLQAVLAYAHTDAEAERIACEQWRQAALSRDELADLATPRAFEAAAGRVTGAELRARIHVSADIDCHADWLRGYAGLGLERIYVHNVVRDHARFFDACAERLLPAFSRA